MVHVIRCVPCDWEHPTDEDGDYIPLYGVSYAEALEAIEYLQRKNPSEDYDDIYGDLSPDECFPEWDDDLEFDFCLYEVVTEGTPVSPVVGTLDDLMEWVRLHFKDEPLTPDDALGWMGAFYHNDDTFAGENDELREWLEEREG
jgi:hypothetical protein